MSDNFKDTLNCCPFCGGNDAMLFSAHKNHDGQHEDACIDCGDCMASMRGKTDEAAIKQWNTRASYSEISVDDEDIFPPYMLEQWCGGSIGGFDTSKRYEVTGTHLKQLMEAYKKLYHAKLPECDTPEVNEAHLSGIANDITHAVKYTEDYDKAKERVFQIIRPFIRTPKREQREISMNEIEQLAVSRIGTWLVQRYDRDYGPGYYSIDEIQRQAKEIWSLVRHYPKRESGGDK